jgi:hypothetical protein
MSRAGEAFGHKCFGCGHEIEPFEQHIHVGLDEWSGQQGLGTFDLDDLFTFPFCSKCIEESDRGWEPEAHEIAEAS